MTSSARNTVSALWDVDMSKRRLEALSELFGVVIGPEMDEEQARQLVQHVVVDGSDLNAVLTHGLQHGGHFLGDQNEIARYRGFAGTGGLKVYCGRQSHRSR